MAHKDFHHPFQPYDIQQQLMEAIYDCIKQGKVGIFESPTGTGKSLSLICGSMTWLREHKRKTFDEAMAAIEVDDDEPDWMAEHARNVKSREMRQMREELEARLTAVRAREEKVKERAERAANGGLASKRLKLTRKDEQEESEQQFILDDYESDKEASEANETHYSADTTKLMEKLGLLPKANNGSSENNVDELKIFFCSRTHSQLSQFAGELKRVRLPPGLPPEQDEEPAGDLVEAIKHLTLGARKNLCINPKVSKLSDPTAINERCIELQQSKTPADRKCPYLPGKDGEDVVLDFRDHALAKVRDIEDLAKLGSKMTICPYYASRSAIAPAEIVTLPYQLLLQKSSREALGISLKGHVVIIDEAHNLMSAVEGMHSTQISDYQLQRAKEGLMMYLQKFRNKLKGSNRTYVAQVVRVVDSLLQFAITAKDQAENGNVTTAAALLAGKNVDQINMSKLIRYINESKLARKVEGYISHFADAKGSKTQHAATDQAPASTPTLMDVQKFLLCLMNPSREGYFLWSKDDGKVVIQYLLLDPSEHFREIAEEARAVILAGGTMSPMDDYKQQLFPYLDNITTFSCGHLIPPSSLFVRAITSDGKGRLAYSFKERTEANAIRLGNALEKIVAKVEGGTVVFFPSYGYLETVIRTWKMQSITHRLESVKALFFDSRNNPAEETFRAYSDAVRSDPRGALLLSVIGGKLSEGINFSDDLGRCVVVVGLPYPNPGTPEWTAKINYLEEQAAARGEPKGKASREHGENLCMRSVNQAIGRAIRHKNDWASILLFDARYADARIQANLPGWIKSSSDVAASGKVDDVATDLEVFFQEKSTQR